MNSGSPAYERLLRQLGRSVRLKGTSVYCGGLDRLNDKDGVFGLVWSDATLEVALHVATMIPNLERHRTFMNKKRHIGNDLVWIVYTEVRRAALTQTLKHSSLFLLDCSWTARISSNQSAAINAWCKSSSPHSR